MSKKAYTKWEVFFKALTSWRTASVSLLSFSSGLPLGLVWISIPDWMRTIGVDIRVVGLFTLAQAPWSFKILWAPLMDRFYPKFLGPRRAWILITQILLSLLILGLAGLGNHPDAVWVVGALCLAIAVASASQDIAIDAYAVEVLEKDEQAIAVGARIAIYRAAMYVAGALTISLAAVYSWKVVNIILAACFIPMMLITLKAPKPEFTQIHPKSLNEAVWKPFLGMLSRHRAIEILLFVILYKLADNFGQALLRPFLVDMGYSDFDRGVALGTIGLGATIAGTFLGGFLTTFLGLGRSLWVFGFLQIFSNLGYVWLSLVDVTRIGMYLAMGFETFTQGLGTGAFSVLLLRLTQKRFSVTQYALFSSLFAIPRIISGPISGVMVDSIGWTNFFAFTLVAGIPGLMMLQRFCSWKCRDIPEFDGDQSASFSWERAYFTSRDYGMGIVASLLSFMVFASIMTFLAMLKTFRAEKIMPDWGSSYAHFFRISAIDDWTRILGVALAALIMGFFVVSIKVARKARL